MIKWNHKPPCIHRKEQIKEVTCSRCPGGGVRIKIFRCPLYGACTIAKRVARVQCCEKCASHTVAPPSASDDMPQH